MITTKEKIEQALARGYCHEKNAKKVLDPDLIQAMSLEVFKLLYKLSA
jgi:hypothetical protein